LLIQIMLVAHIAVLGYWLGSELVINSTYRRIALGSELPFSERTRWMEHVMNLDQHVRYALALQAGLGFMLADQLGYIPGGRAGSWTVAGLTGVWLAFIELTHRMRGRAAGQWLGKLDRATRYGVISVLLMIGVRLVGRGWEMPGWLRVKLLLFGAVVACGVAIRLVLLRHFRVWSVMAKHGPTAQADALVRQTYVQGTLILVALWTLITSIVVVSIWKPA
jgi:hypothetical protein